MASSYRVTTKRYVSQRAEYVARMTSHSLVALEAGKRMILEQVIARAPSTHEEERVMTSWSIQSGKQVGAPASGSRIHFLKDGSKYHQYIREALEALGPALFENFESARRFGFMLRSIDVLDEATHFEWVNEDPRGQTYGPFESKQGTFTAFEYGRSYTIAPVNAPWLIPEEGVKIKGDTNGMVLVSRTVPPYGMFTSINRDEVLQYMNNFIIEQEG